MNNVLMTLGQGRLRSRSCGLLLMSHCLFSMDSISLSERIAFFGPTWE